MIEKVNIDAIVLTVSWDSIDKMVIPLLKSNIPCFIEKPLALTSSKVMKIKKMVTDSKTHIQIGYNRRFYDFIPKIKNYIDNHKVKSIIVEIPEIYNSSNIKSGKHLWINNSSHVLDLINYFVGNYKIKYKHNNLIERKNKNSFNLLLTNDKNIPIHLVANWNSPTNTSIKIIFQRSIILLSPLESGFLYKGFNIIEPTSHNPLRKYIPKVIEDYSFSKEDLKYKPGFLNQHKYFQGLFANQKTKDFKPTSLSDIIFHTQFIESIYK